MAINSINPAKTNTPIAANAATSAIKAASNITLKDSIKHELKDPIGMVSTALTIFQRVKADAVPVFQNEGVIKGIGATAKAVAAGLTGFISDVGVSALLSKAVLKFLPGGGILSTIALIGGNIVIGNFANRIVNKIFPTKMYDNMEANLKAAQTEENNQYTDTFELSSDQNNNTNSYDSVSYTPTSTKTAQKAANPNLKVAYTTKDGLVIYEKPDISMHNYLSTGSASNFSKYA